MDDQIVLDPPVRETAPIFSLGSMPHREITVQKLCEHASGIANKRGQNYPIPALAEAVGGIANLYYQLLIQSNRRGLVITAQNGFVCRRLGEGMLVDEVQKCTGFSRGASIGILATLNQAIGELLAQYQADLGEKDTILFQPIGWARMLSKRVSAPVAGGQVEHVVFECTYKVWRADILAPPEQESHGTLIATLIHLSDTHFGKTLEVSENTVNWFVNHVPKVNGWFGHSYQALGALSPAVNEVLTDRKKRRIPVCVVHTGDLTKRGRSAEMTIGDTFLRSYFVTGTKEGIGLRLGESPPANMEDGDPPGLFIIPGNHDIWGRKNPKYVGAFSDHFGRKYSDTLEIGTKSWPVKLYALDSTRTTVFRHRLAMGKVDSAKANELYKDLREDRALYNNAIIQVVCIHHPVVLPAHIDEEGERLEGRVHIANDLRLNGVHLVLSGHVHNSSVNKGNELSASHPAQDVASTATQLWAPNRSFSVIDLYMHSARPKIFVYPYTYNPSTTGFSRGETIDVSD